MMQSTVHHRKEGMGRWGDNRPVAVARITERIDGNTHRYEGFVGPREEEGVQVDYISEFSMLNCVPNVICRFHERSSTGHDNDGQVREGNDLCQWDLPDCKFHVVVNDANCVRNIGW